MSIHSSLKSVTDLFAFDGEDSLTRFERLAAMYHADTGELAPGKDRRGPDDYDREALTQRYDQWYSAKVSAARETLDWVDAGDDKWEAFARGLTQLSEHTGVHLEGGEAMDRDPQDMLFRYHVEHDGSIVRAGHDSERRNCDDCDFYTIASDVMTCPHCKGSVG